MLGYFGALGIQEFGISKNCIWLKGNWESVDSVDGKAEAQVRSPRESRVERRDVMRRGRHSMTWP